MLISQDAISAEQFYDYHNEWDISDGDVEKALSEAEHVLEGEYRVGGQDHFYLETQASLAIPRGEDREMEIVSTTQAVSCVQMCVSTVLGVPRHKIVCKVKRIG